MHAKLHDPCNFATWKLHGSRVALAATYSYAVRMDFDELAYAKEIGARLRHARKAAHPKMSQGDAAARLADLLGDSEAGGSPASRVSNYENGIRLPDLRTITALCRIYGCSTASILDDEHAAKSEQELKLLQLYRLTDERGKTQITRVAESQPATYAAKPVTKTG